MLGAGKLSSTEHYRSLWAHRDSTREQFEGAEVRYPNVLWSRQLDGGSRTAAMGRVFLD